MADASAQILGYTSAQVLRLHAQAKISDKALWKAVDAGMLTPEQAPVPRPQESANQQEMLIFLKAALVDNRAYLDLASPTAAQRNKQVEDLTKQVNRLIRLATKTLDSAG